MQDGELSVALVIEPDAEARHAATRLFEDLGFVVFGAASVDEACALDAAAPVLHLIATGVPLAEGDHAGTVAELAGRWPEAVLIFATDGATPEQRRRLRGITNLFVLPRPLARGDVRSVLAQAGRGGAPSPSASATPSVA